MSESIRENAPLTASVPRLPDVCAAGVWLRVVLAANLGGLLAAFAREAPHGLLREFLALAAVFDPVLVASLLGFCAMRRLVERLAWPAAAALALATALAATALVHTLLPAAGGGSLWRQLVWALIAVPLLLGWLALRARAQSPAFAEARLMALTARIRPHFLFNALNAVLGVVRSDPRRAERALEELADLFRALMRENRDLVPLSEELSLARQYLELEKLRLGERLQVRWDIDACPVDALVPPLMLQPLLENAVYHGIEPAEGPGELLVRMVGDRHRLAIELSNPVVAGGGHHNGNRMALANIRERLNLFYDAGAHLDIVEGEGRYTVRIIVPNRRP